MGLLVRAVEILAILGVSALVLRWVFNGIGAAWKARIDSRREERRQAHEREMMREARSLAILLQAAPEIADDVETQLAELRRTREAQKART